MISGRKSIAKRYITDKIIDLLAEKEIVKYRRGIVKGNIEKYKAQNDERNASIHNNRYQELIKLEKEITADIFTEVKRLYNGY